MFLVQSALPFALQNGLSKELHQLPSNHYNKLFHLHIYSASTCKYLEVEGKLNVQGQIRKYIKWLGLKYYYKFHILLLKC